MATTERRNQDEELILSAGAVVWLAGCEAKGPAERAGERIDRGIQNAKDAIEPAGPAKEAGRAVDRTVRW
jgi:hypothetical protein